MWAWGVRKVPSIVATARVGACDRVAAEDSLGVLVGGGEAVVANESCMGNKLHRECSGTLVVVKKGSW